MSEESAIGGQGEGLSRGDFVLVRRAIRNRWPVPEVLKNKAMKRAREILDSDGEDNYRHWLAAIKTVIDADKLNLEQEKMDRGQSVTQPVIVNVTSVVAVQPSQIAQTNGHTNGELPRPD